MSIFSFIKSKLSILDVVLEYVQLKKTGSYWKGSCPFHQETDASFTASLTASFICKCWEDKACVPAALQLDLWVSARYPSTEGDVS